MWYVYTMEYHSAIKKNASESVLLRWMNLEPTIQSEVGQKVKDKSRILMHIYEIQKMILKNLFSGQQWRNRLENRCMDMGRGEERVSCLERVTWKLTLHYVKQIANRNLLYDLGNTNKSSVSAQRVGMGREMGRRFIKEWIYVYLWLIHVEV